MSLGFDKPYPKDPKRYRVDEDEYVTGNLVLQSGATLGIQNAALYNNAPVGGKFLQLGSDGTVGCSAGGAGSGSVTSITAGTGLTGGTITSAGTITTNLTAGANVTITPGTGTELVIAATGGGGGGSITTVAAGNGITVAGGTGPTATITNNIAAGSGISISGTSLLTIAATGGGSGTVTSVATNATLSGGPVTTTGTLAVSTDFTGYFIPTTTGGAGTSASPYTNADNTGGIQAAITTLSGSTKRGTVWLGSNMYTVSTPILIGTASNINLKGSNSASTLATVPDVYGTALKLTQGTTCAVEINAAASSSPFPRGNQFKDFTVFGGSSGNNSATALTANAGIKITGPIDQNIFRDLNFCQCTVCIYLPSTSVADSPRFEFLNFDANSYGLYIAPSTIYYYFVFSNNICADMGHVGLFMGSPGGSNPDTTDVDHLVTNNRFVRCAQTAGADPNIPTAGLTSSASVYLGAAQTIFSNNVVQASGGIGIISDSANGLRQVITNNILDKNTGYAIYVNGGFMPLISSNEFLINVQGIFVSNGLNVGQFGAITGNEFQASGTGAGGAAIHFDDIASGSLDHWTTIDNNTFASIQGTGPTIYIGNGHSSITIGPSNTWSSFLPTTAHITIANSACANNVIHLQPNLHITDNGTGTIFVGALGTNATGLLSAGLANKAVIGGSGTGRVFL